MESKLNNEKSSIEEASWKDEEIDEASIKPSNSNIMAKIFKVLIFKIMELIKKEKSLMLLISIIIFLLLKRQFKINFNNFSKMVSFIK